jgi:hypothetical protein
MIEMDLLEEKTIPVLSRRYMRSHSGGAVRIQTSAQLTGKNMLLYHGSQLSRGEEKMFCFFSYIGSLRIPWVRL